MIHVWRWIETQSIPGNLLTNGIQLTGLGYLAHRISGHRHQQREAAAERRHQEQLAAHRAVLDAITAQKEPPP